MAEGTQLRGPSFALRCLRPQDDRICTRRGETAPRKVLFSAQALLGLKTLVCTPLARSKIFVRPSLDPAR